ncbi:MAG TPA: TIGR02265 family protein [Gemmatimonadales bacterium]|nr:TIGR02265 family protein [Gemmatimonadales bacterium]
MQQIKGAVLKSRLAFVEEHFGKDGVQRVLQSLAPDDQRPLRMLFTSNWYPFELGRRLDDAIVRVLGNSRPEFFERLGAASADKNLGSLHSGYLTRGDPHAFLAKAPQIYALYYETGRREYQRAGDQAGVLIRHEAETFSAPDCLTVVGWYRRALELCGAREVRVEEVECRAKGGSVCRYDVAWR